MFIKCLFTFLFSSMLYAGTLFPTLDFSSNKKYIEIKELQ